MDYVFDYLIDCTIDFILLKNCELYKTHQNAMIYHENVMNTIVEKSRFFLKKKVTKHTKILRFIIKMLRTVLLKRL